MNFPISIGRTSLFQILGVLGSIFHFYSNSNRTFCEKTMETLIRRRVLHCLPISHEKNGGLTYGFMQKHGHGSDCLGMSNFGGHRVFVSHSVRTLPVF